MWFLNIGITLFLPICVQFSWIVILPTNTKFHYGQTEDQYIFIHDALLEAVICGNTEVAARNLHTHIQKLMLPETGENITGMELEFKVSITFKMFSFC